MEGHSANFWNEIADQIQRNDGKEQQKSTKNRAKIHQNGSKIGPGGVLEGSGSLSRRWTHAAEVEGGASQILVGIISANQHLFGHIHGSQGGGNPAEQCRKAEQ